MRDGGYRNDWNFPAEFIVEYLKAIERAGIDIVEMGLRLVKQDESYGELAYCRDEYLENLNIPDKLMVAVMIKADELLDCDAEKELNVLFADAESSPVDMVRIAVPYQRALECRQMCDILKNKDYNVALSLTKVVPGTENDILATVKAVKEWGNFDILYIADTFGELMPYDLTGFIRLIRQEYDGLLGFHGHNDKRIALENSLTALDNGVDYVDSTFSGIGKGAGNLPTEVIAAELNVRYGQKFNLQVLSAIQYVL